MRRGIAIHIISGLLILLFVHASVSKLLDFEKFKVELSKSPMLTSFAGLLAWVIPILEIIISVMLTTRRFRLFALYASFCLMTMFTTYIVIILKFSAYVPCSCGGVLQNMTWKQHLYFNTGFLLLTMVGVLLFSSPDVNIKKPIAQ